MIKQQTRKWELRVLFPGRPYSTAYYSTKSVGLLSSSVEADSSLSLSLNTRQNIRIGDGCSILCSVPGGLGFCQCGRASAELLLVLYRTVTSGYNQRFLVKKTTMLYDSCVSVLGAQLSNLGAQRSGSDLHRGLFRFQVQSKGHSVGRTSTVQVSRRPIGKPRHP
jgi:hypothetical protein